MADKNIEQILIEFNKLKQSQQKQKEATKKWISKHPEKLLEYREKLKTDEYKERYIKTYVEKYKEKYKNDPNIRLKQAEANKRYYEKKKLEQQITITTN
jgi:hypothetical protein